VKFIDKILKYNFYTEATTFPFSGMTPASIGGEQIVCIRGGTASPSDSLLRPVVHDKRMNEHSVNKTNKYAEKFFKIECLYMVHLKVK